MSLTAMSTVQVVAGSDCSDTPVDWVGYLVVCFLGQFRLKCLTSRQLQHRVLPASRAKSCLDAVL